MYTFTHAINRNSNGVPVGSLLVFGWVLQINPTTVEKDDGGRS